jgi:hypothetical protein
MAISLVREMNALICGDRRQLPRGDQPAGVGKGEVVQFGGHIGHCSVLA